MSGGPLRGIADVEQDTPRPLQLQPWIFSQQMSSIGAVARSRHFGASSEEPMPRLRAVDEVSFDLRACALTGCAWLRASRADRFTLAGRDRTVRVTPVTASVTSLPSRSGGFPAPRDHRATCRITTSRRPAIPHPTPRLELLAGVRGYRWDRALSRVAQTVAQAAGSCDGLVHISA
jgi:hypothetical protein